MAPARAPHALAAAAVLVLALACVARAETCPQETPFNGCVVDACISLASGTKTKMVCDKCGHGYVLVNARTRYARCDCAPGFFGKGNKLICRPCPTGTQVAAGGAKVSSECLGCPPGTLLDGGDCVCPAGSYRARARQAKGLMEVSCVPCAGPSAFVALDKNKLGACSTCATGKVANVNHTLCVDPSDPTAFKEPAKATNPVAKAVGAATSDVQGIVSNIQSAAAGALTRLQSITALAKVGDLKGALDSLRPGADSSSTGSGADAAAGDDSSVGDLDVSGWAA